MDTGCPVTTVAIAKLDTRWRSDSSSLLSSRFTTLGNSRKPQYPRELLLTPNFWSLLGYKRTIFSCWMISSPRRRLRTWLLPLL
ncbi:hypothetical protein AMELA_G00017220 [Ameiurus melas]|uniref:Uncharacterized protein n=1 Tax=Ameiurus melas TaxID=219545 RepID=A0A7J6BC94_AMEME|nr:hypothetical protein AMELA_G00017220 [Ameiurus melas]